MTVNSERRKIIAGYMVKSPVSDPKKVQEVALLFVKGVGEKEEIAVGVMERVRQELEAAVKESIGGKVTEVHEKLAEFVQKFVSHYEAQIFS